MIDYPEEWKGAYQVKLTSKYNGGEIWGLFTEAHPDAADLWEKGQVLVEDAITGALYALDHKQWTVERFRFGGTFETDPETGLFTHNAFERHVNDAFKAAKKRHNEAGDGVRKGKLCVIPVADGCAYYEITKVNKKTCKVEWRGFWMDRWVDPRWGYGKTIPLSEAEQCLMGW